MQTNDDKYYTPDISEFHVGFECENNDNQRNEWRLKKYDVSTLLEMLSGIEGGYISVNNYRVKKLNRQDIEELGWEFGKEDTTTVNGVSVGLNFMFGKYNMRFFTTEMSGGWITIGDDYGVQLYHGLCRNKSHLARLMKDLGIHNDKKRWNP